MNERPTLKDREINRPANLFLTREFQNFAERNRNS